MNIGTHHGSTTSGTGLTPTTGASHHPSTIGQGYGSTNVGPHSSNLANEADPLVDSDLDGRGLSGTTTEGTGLTRTGLGSTRFSSGTSTGTGVGSTGQGYGSTTAGPHLSNLANKVDPRIDSDLDGRGTGSMTAGVANRLDPHLSSSSTSSGLGSATTRGNFGSTSTGSTTGASNAGTATDGYTTGPHKSALLNKLDPR